MEVADALTPAQLAAALNISERTVQRMVQEGCPSMLVRARRRFDLAAVKAWTQQKAQECPSAKTKMAVGTQKLASAVAAFTDASRTVRLRVMPSASKQS